MNRHLFLISSASVRSLLFLSFIIPIHAWCVSLISPSYLKRSLVLPSLLFSYISLHCSFKKFFLSPCYTLDLYIQWGVSFPFSFAFYFSSFFSSLSESLLRQLLCLLAFLFLWDGFGYHLLHTMLRPWSIVLQALCLPDLIPWVSSSPPLYNQKGFDLGHTWMA